MTAGSSAAHVHINAIRRKRCIAVVSVIDAMSEFEFVGEADVMAVIIVASVVLLSVACIYGMPFAQLPFKACGETDFSQVPAIEGFHCSVCGGGSA